jgi:ketosteroid isomerase-like protein
MAEEPAAVVRRMMDEFIAGDFTAALSHYAADVEGDFTHMPDGTVVHDPEGIRREVARWRSSWESFETDVEEITATGDLVLLVVRQSGVGKSSGTPIEMRYAQHFRVHDGEVVWMKTFLDVDEARREAGQA